MEEVETKWFWPYLEPSGIPGPFSVLISVLSLTQALN